MLRAIRRRLLLWNAEAIRAEREAYQQAGAVGPQYLANSRRAERECRRKARAIGAKQ